MGAPAEPPSPLGLAAARSLVQVVCAKGRLLALQPDNTLRFVSSGEGGATALWVLAALADRAGAAAGAPCHGRYVLQSAASGNYLSAAGGQLGCAGEPTMLQIYMDMNRGAVLGLGGRACLQAGPKGAASAGQLPLGRDRASKLFSFREAGLPEHSLRAWPLRATLRCEAASGSAAAGYLSAGNGGTLSVGAPVACCSEEFLLAPGEASPLSVHAGSLLAPACRVWAGCGTRLLSTEPLTGRVLLAEQHACTGHECFTLQLSCAGEARLLAEAPAAAEGGRRSGGGSGGGMESSGGEEPSTGPASVSWASNDGLGRAACSSAAAATVVQHDVLLATGSETRGAGGGSVAGKPTTFALDLASGKPSLLLTAHGHLLSCPPVASGGGARPAGVLLPAQGAAAAGGAAAAAAPVGPSPAAVQRCAWVLQHHGDSVYSMRHALTGQSLYIDDHGAPCLDPPGGRIVHPDERLLFWIEFGWVTLSASNGEVLGGSGSPGSSGSGGSGGASQPEVAGFAQPSLGSGSAAAGGSGGLTVAGFSIRSVRRVGGRHVRLAALPDGLLTTVHAMGRPSRWELFQVADLLTLLESPLDLVQRLPCAPAAAAAAATALQPQAALRRAASMQALGSGPGGFAGHGDGGRGLGECQRSPSLPAVLEQQEGEGLAAAHLLHSRCAAPLPSSPAAVPQPPSPPPRRCASDSALTLLDSQQRRCQLEQAGRPRPSWLALQLQTLPEPGGWGAVSPASLQELACRQLCASLAAEYHKQHGGGPLPTGLAEAVEEELSTHLPEELCARIARQLHLLLEPPAPTKLSLHRLCKASAAEPKDVPAWALPHLPPGGDPLGLQWQPTEAFLCVRCRGASRALLPLDPYTNPAHHLFLHAMERAARGGGRLRLRQRGPQQEQDLIIRALQTGKLLLLAWAAGRALGAVLPTYGGGAGRRRG